MPHLHLSLQAADDMVLKRMKRRHGRAGAAAAIARARPLRPGIAIGADLIAGFPTETDAQAADTLEFVREHAIPYLHVFPYSERPGTPAARMPATPCRSAASAPRVCARPAPATRTLSTPPTRRRGRHARRARDGAATPSISPRCGSPAGPGEMLRARITGADARGLPASAA